LSLLHLTLREFGVSYLLPRSESSLWACVCLEDLFTPLVRSFVEANDVVQPALAQAYRETWPIVSELLDNGFSEAYKHGGLIILDDPDDAASKWFLASVVGNLPSLSYDDVLNDRSLEALGRVFNSADVAPREYSSYHVDRRILSVRVFGRSVGKDVRAYAGFLRDNFGSIAQLLASG
jgi:hypothetical protein